VLRPEPVLDGQENAPDAQGVQSARVQDQNALTILGILTASLHLVKTLCAPQFLQNMRNKHKEKAIIKESYFIFGLREALVEAFLLETIDLYRRCSSYVHHSKMLQEQISQYSRKKLKLKHI